MDAKWFLERKAALGLTDAAIARALGRDRSTANRLVNGITPIDLQHLPGLSEAFQVSREEVMRRAGMMEEGERTSFASNAVPIKMEGASLERARDDLPIWGTALGAEKQFDGEAIEQTTLNSGDIVEYAQRPVLLNRRQDAYGLYVQGSSMHPALPDGEMLAVAPRMPLGAGDNVVVYLRPLDPDMDDGETARAVLVKELVRRTSAYVELRQYSPAKDFRVEMVDVIRIDRVLTRREMLS